MSVVNRVDVRVGGGFEIAMTAVQPDIVRYLESAGIPVTSYDRGDYAEVVLQARLVWTGMGWEQQLGKLEAHLAADRSA